MGSWLSSSRAGGPFAQLEGGEGGGCNQFDSGTRQDKGPTQDNRNSLGGHLLRGAHGTLRSQEERVLVFEQGQARAAKQRPVCRSNLVSKEVLACWDMHTQSPEETELQCSCMQPATRKSALSTVITDCMHHLCVGRRIPCNAVTVCTKCAPQPRPEVPT